MQEGHLCKHGNDVFSYETCIQTFDDETKKWVYNVTQYSMTTSRHQAEAFGFPRKDYAKHLGHAVMVDNVPRGASPYTLRERARLQEDAA